MRCPLLLSLLVPMLVLLPAGPAPAATVVSNSGVPSPLFTRNVESCGGTGSGGSLSHVNGPGTPPLGTGSLRLQSGAGANSFALARSFGNAPASTLTAFKAAHNEPPATPSGAFSMQIDALQTSSASVTDKLFVHPPATNGAWATVDLLSPSTPLTLFRGSSPSTTTYAQYLQDNPAAVLLSIEIYDTTCSSTNQTTYVDDLVIGVDGVTTTYDFEAPAAQLASSLSATTITAGKSLTASVVARDAGAAPVAGAQVKLYARTYPSTTYRLVTTVSTSATGLAKVVVRPLVATTYKWVMPPTAFAPATSALRSVRVRTALTARAADTTLTRRQAVVVKGTTFRPRPGATVQLMRKTASGPRLVTSAKVASNGTFSLRHTLPAGIQRVFVHIGSGNGEIANNSLTVTVSVR